MPDSDSDEEQKDQTMEEQQDADSSSDSESEDDSTQGRKRAVRDSEKDWEVPERDKNKGIYEGGEMLSEEGAEEEEEKEEQGYAQNATMIEAQEEVANDLDFESPRSSQVNEML